MIFKNKDSLCVILVFLSSFLFIITVGIPNLLLDDSLITVEQLHQLSSGDQVRISEGYYGRMENGTEYEYMKARNGVLLYSLILPIISLPALFFIDQLGMHFSFFIISIWSLLLLFWVLFLGDIIRNDHNLYSKYRYFVPTIFLLVFLFFFLNLLLYIPNVTSSRSYYEIPAVILTNHILFACIPIFLFLSFRLLNYSRVISMGYSICTMFCSSYLFWAAEAKDHILVAFLLSLFIFFLLSFIIKRAIYYHYLCLTTSGIITWARPEIGVAVFLVLFIFSIYLIYSGTISSRSKVLNFIIYSVIFCIIGLSPFFINNILVTDNPFTPAYISLKEDNNLSLDNSNDGIINSFSDDFFNSKVMNQEFVNIIQFPNNALSSPATLLKILFNPSSGSLGVFAVNPLPLIFIILLLFLVLNKVPFELTIIEKTAAIFFCLLSFFLIVVYLIIDYDGLDLSQGVMPDVRYLSPAYLPMSLVCLLVLRPIFSQNLKKSDVTRILSIWLILFILVSLIFFTSACHSISTVNDLFTFLSFFTVSIFIIGVILYKKNRISYSVMIILFSIVVIIPFFWQIDALFYYALRRRLGYDFWLPLSGYLYSFLFNNFFTVR